LFVYFLVFYRLKGASIVFNGVLTQTLYRAVKKGQTEKASELPSPKYRFKPDESAFAPVRHVLCRQQDEYWQQLHRKDQCEKILESKSFDVNTKLVDDSVVVQPGA